MHIDFKSQQYLTDVNDMTCLLLYGKGRENLKMPNHDGIANNRKTGLTISNVFFPNIYKTKYFDPFFVITRAVLFIRSTCDYKRSTPKNKSLMSAKQW